MMTRRQVREARQRRSRRIRALLAAGIVFGVGAAATLSAWNDAEYATSTITAGTFGIVSRSDAGAFTDHASIENALVIPLDATGLYPGESSAAFVQIQANGSVAGTVNLTAVTVTDADGNPLTGDAAQLRDALQVGVKVTTSESSSPPECTPSTIPDTTVTGVGNLPDLTAAGLEANAGNTVTYCIIVTLLPSAADNVQGQEIQVLWTFTGTSGQ